MKILSWIVLGIGVFLLTFLITASTEYFIPGSINWVMMEIDYWFSKIWGWTIFTIFILSMLCLFAYLAYNFGPLLLPFIRKVAPTLGPTVSTWAHSDKGQKTIIIALIVIGVLILLSVIAVGIWVLTLML